MDIVPQVTIAAILMLVGALILALVALAVMEWGRKR